MTENKKIPTENYVVGVVLLVIVVAVLLPLFVGYYRWAFGL